MFYADTILSKKGKLALVWLAAHWEKKLTKHQITSTDLTKAVESIIGPDEVPMALRLLGHLLLGVCRLYSRKIKYLLQDSNEALTKIKMAFRPDTVDQLQETSTVASFASITLRPESIQLAFYDDTIMTLPQIDEYTVPSETITMQFEEIEHARAEAPMHGDFGEEVPPSPEQVRRASPFFGGGEDFGEDFGGEDFGDFVPTFPAAGIEGEGEEPFPILAAETTEEPGAVRVGMKRVRIDYRTTLSADLLKNRLQGIPDDLVEEEPTLAPPTKRQMLRLEYEQTDAETLFNNPAFGSGMNRLLAGVLERAMTLRLPTGAGPERELTPEIQPVDFGRHDDFEGAEEFDFGDDFGGDSPGRFEPEFAPASPGAARPGEEEPEVTRRAMETPSAAAAAEAQAAVEREKERTYLSLMAQLHKQEQVSFHKFTQGKSKGEAAHSFFELLLRKTRGEIQLQQDRAYGDILITFA